MIQEKANRINKKRLSIIITAAVLILLIVAYAILSAILPGLSLGSSDRKDPPEILDGEAVYGNMPVIYPYLKKDNITSVTVGSHVDTFSMVKPTGDDGKHLDYFVFYYEDPNGDLAVYMPEISDKDAEFSYSDLYAIELSDGRGVQKIEYLMAAIGALYFDERILLSDIATEKNEQLNRYGLGREDRETVIIKYLNSEGKELEHKLYVGDKLITGVGYYFMLDGRDYVYTSTASNTLSYALGGFEGFLNSRIVAAELTGDNGAAPYHTNDYRQWTSSYHNTLGDIIPTRVDVIVKADYVQPIYADITDESDEVIGKGTGYRYSGYKDVTFELSSLSSSEFERLVAALVGKAVGDLPAEESVTVVTDMNEATLFDPETGKGVYEYTIYAIESVITDKGEITAEGSAVSADSLIKVEYSFALDGVSGSSERCHAVIDLSAESVISSEIKSQLVAGGVGALDSPITFTAKYTKDNVKTRKIEYIITDISLIIEVNDEDQSVKYLDKVTENSIVSYTFKYLLDGVEIGAGDIMTVDLSAAKEGHYLNVKNALVGKSSGEQSISVKDDVYCQPFMDFRAYNIKSILGYVKTEQTVGFKFVPEGKRDTFYGESIYMNTLPSDNRYSNYAMNDEACDQVLRILGGITTDSNTSSGAQGLEGFETVAIGLSHANMEKYGLYEGDKIFFELPRGLNSYANSEDYEWLYRVGFTLYVGERQPDGTRYVGSDMYDIVVKIDASIFDFLDFSFPEYWARRNLAMIGVSNIDKVTLDLNMTDVYGKYDFNLNHETRYYGSNSYYDDYDKIPEGESTTEYDFITVRVRPLGERHSETLLSNLIAQNSSESNKVKDLDLAVVYNKAAGISPGNNGLMVGYDTLGTSSFKDLLRILYSTYYLGVLSAEDQAKATEDNRLMSLSFDVGSSSAYSYNYDFYRIDDRRVMVSLYRADGETKIGEVSDFYITTLAFKKLVTNFTNLLNGVELNADRGY